jgi:hypothetical protein
MLHFGNPMAYFAAKAGFYTKPSVEILAIEIWCQIARLKPWLVET